MTGWWAEWHAAAGGNHLRKHRWISWRVFRIHSCKKGSRSLRAHTNPHALANRWTMRIACPNFSRISIAPVKLPQRWQSVPLPARRGGGGGARRSIVSMEAGARLTPLFDGGDLSKQPLQACEMLLIVAAKVVCQAAHGQRAVPFELGSSAELFRGKV